MEKLLLLPSFLDIDREQTVEFLVRFFSNVISLLILIRLLYYNYRKDGIPEYMFSFFLLGITVFMICTSLEMVVVDFAFALGLFALFGILRFRTESIPVREMTYLFLVIGVSMINSLIDFNSPMTGIILLNTLMIIPTWIMEIFLTRNNFRKQELTYDRVEDAFLKESELIPKLIDLTGLEIRKAKVTKIDLTRGQVTIIIFYKV